MSVLIYDRSVVADWSQVQKGYLRHASVLSREERRQMPFGHRALENLARLTDSLL